MRRTLAAVSLLAAMLVSFSAPAWADTNYAPPTLPTGPYGIMFQVLPANDTFDLPIGFYMICLGGHVASDGKMDAPTFTSPQGRAMIPVRYLADALGAQTSWDAATQTVTITRGGTTIVMVIGSKTLTVNGKTSQMDVAPVIYSECDANTNWKSLPPRTFLPARYVAEAMGATVQYNSYTHVALISVGGFTAFPPAYLQQSS
jgi:hypothetical protein